MCARPARTVSVRTRTSIKGGGGASSLSRKALSKAEKGIYRLISSSCPLYIYLRPCFTVSEQALTTHCAICPGEEPHPVRFVALVLYILYLSLPLMSVLYILPSFIANSVCPCHNKNSLGFGIPDLWALNEMQQWLHSYL